MTQPGYVCPFNNDPASIALEIGCGSNPGAPGAPFDAWWICGDRVRLPIRDDAISAITLRAVLHHIPDGGAFLTELARVLRSGGSLTVVDGVALPAAVAQALDAELLANGHPPEPIYGFDLDDLCVALRQAGFEIQSTRIEGTATWATPPFVSTTYTSDRFTLVAHQVDPQGANLSRH